MFIRFCLLLLFFSSSLLLSAQGNSSSGGESGNPNPDKWKAFSYIEEAASDGLATFIEEETIHASIVPLVEELHFQDKLDSLYLTLDNPFEVTVSGSTHTVKAGDVVFVKGGVEHVLHPGENSKTILRVSPTSMSSAADADYSFHAGDKIREPWKSDANEWNPFLQVGSMMFGLYMLPQALGGDDTLTHQIDEINIVLKGEARFRMDDDQIEVGPGSVMWVKSGVGHNFHDLSEDFEVLILFRRN